MIIFSDPLGDGLNPSPLGEEKFKFVAMRRYKTGAHTKTDLKGHVVWIPKYLRSVLVGPVPVRTRGILRQITPEHELEIIFGKVASEHVHIVYLITTKVQL